MSSQPTPFRILLVHYSQTGRSSRLARSFCAPLKNRPDIELDELALQLETPYPFPWPFFDFLDAFPESVQLRAPKLARFSVAADARYDLIILSATVWFLSPAPPITAFLTSAQGKALLSNTPVITLVSCRNMWLRAHDALCQLLQDAGARHCDNVVYTDQSPALATFITTPRWMLTGKRDGFPGLPPAGITDQQIQGASRFGKAIVQAIEKQQLDGTQPVLTGLRAVHVDDRLFASERIGHRSFSVWSRLVRLFGGPGSAFRRPVLLLYSVFLVTMIATVVPVSLLVRGLLHKLLGDRGAAIRAHYAAPSGSGSERMQQFAP